ncbi:hypothetical protein CASFOL_014918 [Castilleja foliolosa]|uniref:3'-5' exonuclease domain-containing protein n=1 Tax=Castilleja foliolosa TaxID=1961234 RepID=A0ABD3DCA1_9LAMI
MEVWDGQFCALHTAEDWGKATEECKTSKKLYAHRATNVPVNLRTLPEEDIAERVETGSVWMKKVVCLSGLDNMGYQDFKIAASGGSEIQKRLSQVYDKVLVVNCVDAARDVVKMLTNEYKNLVHACDTEQTSMLKKKHQLTMERSYVLAYIRAHRLIMSVEKSCVWVDVLEGGGKDLIKEFAPFFEDPSIKKVWHNYSFDNHVIENYGLKLSGFYADTMHMARLWNSSRRTQGGYSLEALTGDPAVMFDSKCGPGETAIGKVSMKNIFRRRKTKKDGTEGKLITIPPGPRENYGFAIRPWTR